MKILLVLLLGIFVGFVFALVWLTGMNEETKLIGEMVDRKKENLKRLLKYFNDNPRVTNNDAERLLGVSNSTAFRYLEELERGGKIRQIGKTGAGVYYEKI